MTSRNRRFILVLSTCLMVFAFVGGYLGQTIAKDDTYQHLRVFEDVVSLVLNNYVEPVDVREAMKGAMKGLTDGLDPDSAFLTSDLVRSLESKDPGGAAEVGLDLTRQYYLRVVSARDGSPAAKAGLRPGDFIRAIDKRPTRDMSAFEGMRLLRGAPGTKVALLVIRGNAADPHEIELTRERLTTPAIASRMANGTTGVIRLAEFSANTPTQITQAVDTLTKTGATRFVIDVRGTSRGDLDDGIAAARLFVKDGPLTVKLSRGGAKETVASNPGDGAMTAPVAVLIDQGTAYAAEVFAAALDEDDRADLVGFNTLGRAARQRLVKLPDQSGLWLTYVRYLTPDSNPIHETGLEPDVDVELPEIEFGTEPPVGDAALQKALDHIAAKK